MNRKLPIYDAIFDEKATLGTIEDGGISVISLVEKPAVESNFMKFEDDETSAPKTNIIDDEQRIIVGAVLIPDKLIYRNSERGEFFIRFSESVIKNMHLNMMRTKSFSYFSIAHNGSILPDWQITPLEIWRKEFEEDKSNGYGFDLPVGTLFISAKVEDEQIWERIKANEINGFSIEAILDYKYSNMEKFLFNKLEVGEQVVQQKAEGVEFKFSGDFVEGDNTVVVEEGVIKEIKPTVEPAKEPEAEPTVELNAEPTVEPANIEEILKKVTKVESALSSMAELVTKLTAQFETQVQANKEEAKKLLLRAEEIKLASQQENKTDIKAEATKMSRLEIIEKMGTVKR